MIAFSFSFSGTWLIHPESRWKCIHHPIHSHRCDPLSSIQYFNHGVAVVIHRESVSNMNSVHTLEWVGIVPFCVCVCVCVCLNDYNLLLVFVNGSQGPMNLICHSPYIEIFFFFFSFSGNFLWEDLVVLKRTVIVALPLS